MRTNNKFPAVTLLYMLFLLPYLNIAAIRSAAGGFYEAWQILGAFALTGRLLQRSKAIKLNTFYVMFLLYEMIIFFSTTLHHGFSPGILVMIYVAIVLVFLMQSDSRYVVQALAILTVWMACVNLCSMFALGVGGNQIFFIGGRNRLSMVLIPSMFLVMLNSLNQRVYIRKSDYAFAALCIGSVVLGKSATGLVVSVAAVAALLILKNVKNGKGMLLGIVLVMNLMLVLGVEVLFESRYWIGLTSFLGKSATLTARSELWNAVRIALQDNFFLGLGRGTEIIFPNPYGGWTISYEAHNFILEILFEGGICAFVCYVSAFVYAIRGLNLRDIRHRMVFLLVFVQLINGMTESINNDLFLIISVALAGCYSCQEKKRMNDG